MRSQILRWIPAVLSAFAVSPACAQSATITVPGLGQVMAGSDLRQTMACKGGAVTVSGSGNRVTAATVGRIVPVNRGSRLPSSVTGSGNLVTKR